MAVAYTLHSRRLPEPSALLELLKPITWFPPMWAYLCGVVSAGVCRWGELAAGAAGRGAGRARRLRDEPGRERLVRPACRRDERTGPARSPRAGFRGAGACGSRWRCRCWRWRSAGFWAPGALARPCVGVIAAWAYSAEPVRLKRSGWWGPGLVGLCYEGLPWFTGAAVLSTGAPSVRDRDGRRPLRLWRAWHHDAERFQGAGGRPPARRPLAARGPGARGRGQDRLHR